MNGPPEKFVLEASLSGRQSPDQQLGQEIDERRRSVRTPTERRTIAGLLREIGPLPLEHTRAALETSAAIAGVSLRASIEFLRSVPGAAQVLEAAELRAWGELGRRLTMGEVEDGVSFFVAGLAEFDQVPPVARPFVFQVCSRQMTLSAKTAAETFRNAPALAKQVSQPDLLRSIYEIAAEISRRSAKHSSDFLNAAPAVIAGLIRLDANDPPADACGSDFITARAAIALTSSFAERAGGIAADAWASLPQAIDQLAADQALKLMRRATSFLERGGAAGLNILIAGGEILRALPECFDDWIDLLWAVASHRNAGLGAFIRSSPAFFQTLASTKDHESAIGLARRVIALTREGALVDSEPAPAGLRSVRK